MYRAAILATLIAFAASAPADGASVQVETIVFTAHVLSAKQEALYKKYNARLTPAGKTFVKDAGRRVHQGILAVDAARDEAEHNCTKAFAHCTGDDGKALAFLVLSESFAFDPTETSRLLKGIPQPVLDRASAKSRQLEEKGDMTGAAALWLAALPPDRRAILVQMKYHSQEIRTALSQVASEIKS